MSQWAWFSACILLRIPFYTSVLARKLLYFDAWIRFGTSCGTGYIFYTSFFHCIWMQFDQRKLPESSQFFFKKAICSQETCQFRRDNLVALLKKKLDSRSPLKKHFHMIRQRNETKPCFYVFFIRFEHFYKRVNNY